MMIDEQESANSKKQRHGTNIVDIALTSKPRCWSAESSVSNEPEMSATTIPSILSGRRASLPLNHRGRFRRTLRTLQFSPRTYFLPEQLEGIVSRKLRGMILVTIAYLARSRLIRVSVCVRNRDFSSVWVSGETRRGPEPQKQKEKLVGLGSM